MKILVTGSHGFIAKNLIVALNQNEDYQLLLINKANVAQDLEAFVKQADFIVHLAGVNRPQNVAEFYQGNTELTQTLIGLLEKHQRRVPIVFSSSVQVDRDNDYGNSKLKAEKLIQDYAAENKVPAFIYRLPNVFGKWCKPNYNSVIATWCHNVAHNLPVQINDPETRLSLVYIDDVVESFIECINAKGSNADEWSGIEVVYEKTLAEIASLLDKFKQGRESLEVLRIGSGFERALYASYLSYLPPDRFSYLLQGHQDERGTFYEILKTLDSGQLSVSTSKPGITRGNHYHQTKNEKFLVIHGEALIELRHILSKNVTQYRVSGTSPEVVEMIPGYTHNITNIGEDEMVLLIWANETFDNQKPDTYFLNV